VQEKHTKLVSIIYININYWLPPNNKNVIVFKWMFRFRAFGIFIRLALKMGRDSICCKCIIFTLWWVIISICGTSILNYYHPNNTLTTSVPRTDSTTYSHNFSSTNTSMQNQCTSSISDNERLRR
jgi:hypothetical protein